MMIIKRTVNAASLGEKEVDMYVIAENGQTGKERRKVQSCNRRCKYINFF